MKNVLKNKKGFTLVELLAVIVILALIMAIAIVSMSGVIDNARLNTTKNNALYCIDAVRNNLMINNRLDDGTYYFTNGILEKGGTSFAFGGEYKYATANDLTSLSPTEIITGKLWKVTGTTTCNNEAKGAFVNITTDSSTGDKVYTICMPTDSTDGYYVYGTSSAISNAENRSDIIGPFTQNNG